MKVYATLWGGASYVWEDEPTEYHSLAAVVREYQDRMRSGNHQFPCYGDRHVNGVDENGRMVVGWLFIGQPGDYPDRVLTIGPNDGLRLERA